MDIKPAEGGGYSHYGLTGGSGLFEGPAKDYQIAQFREITLPLGGILVFTNPLGLHHRRQKHLPLGPKTPHISTQIC